MFRSHEHLDDSHHQERALRIERVVTWSITVWLVVLSWVVSGRLWWTQAAGAVLGAVVLAVAISLPQNRRQLWRFPVFWFGLAFLLIILCQALNPWVRAVETKPGIFFWQLYTIKHIDWLPSGVVADYAEMDTWRTLVYWLSPWLFVCAWWVAVRRRRPAHRLLWTVFLNGLVICLVMFIQSRYQPDKLMWWYTEPDMSPDQMRLAGFSSRNPVGMFLYLSMAAGFALACQMYVRSRVEGHDSGLTWVILLGCLVIFATFFALGGRAVLIIGGCIFVAGLLALFVTSLGTGGPSPGLWLGGGVLVLGLATLLIFQFTGNNSWTVTRWLYLSAHPEQDVRQILRQTTLRMVKDHPWLGSGGGSYRYISPDYFRAADVFGSSTNYGGLSLRFNYAHSDWLQFAMEFGLIGSAFPLAILLYLYFTALRLSRWLGAAGALLLFATAMLLIHATGDFPVYNAAVFMLFAMLLVSTIKTASLEARQAAAKYVD